MQVNRSTDDHTANKVTMHALCENCFGGAFAGKSNADIAKTNEVIAGIESQQGRVR